MIPGANKSPIIKWDWQFLPEPRARPMTYQTTNSLRRSRGKSHILFYRSSHLSKSKSITGAGATNGYRMFSTWYPSAIDDYRNARLGYKACIIALGYEICFKERLKLQIIYTRLCIRNTSVRYIGTSILYVRVSNGHRICLEYSGIQSIERVASRVDNMLSYQKYVNYGSESSGTLRTFDFSIAKLNG